MENKNYTDQGQRARIGKLSGLLGIICNFILACSKLIVGQMAGSMAIFADGVNNLSDAGSSFVTLLGFRMAERPADREHPYGHARYEYLASLTVAVMILVVGVELGKSSVQKLIHPENIEYSGVLVAVLIFSIFVKLGMMIYNTVMGRRIKSGTLIATAADSRNDVITTAAVLAATLVEHFTSWKIDGVMGLVVALFILYSGFDLLKQAISTLLGEGASPDLRHEITEYVLSHQMVLGCHDLMVHDYGPGRCYATIHVEMDRDVDTMLCHEIIDNMERECLEKFNAHLVIHYDPVITDDEEINRVRDEVQTLIKEYDERLTMHDFRMLRCKEYRKLLFDMVISEDLQGREEDIRNHIEHELNGREKEMYRLIITFDLSDI